MKYVRKLVPVPSYDIPGMESWLEEQAAQGLYLKRYGPRLCTFTRDVPRTLRCRLDYCDTDRDPDPIPGLIALYREMGWNYVCRVGSLFLFCTQDPHAPEPHTDPQTHAQLLKQLEGQIKRVCSFFAWMLVLFFSLFLFGILKYGSPLVALAQGALANVGLFLGLIQLIKVIPALLDWRRVHRMVAALEAGIPLTPIPTASRRRRVLHLIALVLIPLVLCLSLAYLLLPHPQTRWSLGAEGHPGDFTPVLLSQWEGSDYRPDLWEMDGVTILNSCQWDMTLLCPTRWQVQQRGNIGPETVCLELYWYHPILPALDQPLARDLLSYLTSHEQDTRQVSEPPLGPWTVTEHQVAGADYLATAYNPNSANQYAVAAGNGRTVSLSYQGPQNLEDHLEEIAAMLAVPTQA